MITNTEQLKEVMEFEKSLYGISRKSYLWGIITNTLFFRIWQWQYYSRKSDWYAYKYTNNRWYKSIHMYYLLKRNVLARKLGFDIDTKGIGKGLLIYHPGATIINGSSIIGENCILHGNNCIGNKGPAGSPCPVIGNNVEIGVGAKIIGGVTIADNIKIGAGAVVVSSFLEEGITIGGVPARKIK